MMHTCEIGVGSGESARPVNSWDPDLK